MNNEINYSSCYEDLRKCNNGFVDLIPLLSRRTPINIIVGSRGTGKSTGVAIMCLIDYLKNGYEFLYVRRRKDDIQMTAPGFFKNAIDIINRNTEYKIDRFRYYNGEYQIGSVKEIDDKGKEVMEWVKCGEAKALSLEEKAKSSVLSKVRTIIYDEFISKNVNAYIGTKADTEAEWRALCSLYQTVDRGIDKPSRNETSMFLMANKSTIYNPICISLGIPDYYDPKARIISQKKGRWAGLWSFYNVKSVPATEDIKKSIAYAISDEVTQMYAYDNESAIDNDSSFIKRVKGTYHHTCNMSFKNEKYGLWRRSGNYYIDNPKPGEKFISLDVEGFEENAKNLIDQWRSSPIMCELRTAYTLGKLYFKDVKTKVVFLRYLQFMA